MCLLCKKSLKLGNTITLKMSFFRVSNRIAFIKIYIR